MGIEKHQEKLSESCKNFKYLDDLIHSGEKKIVIDSDIILNEDEVSRYLDGIKLNVKDCVIDGNGHTVDACGKTRIFESMGENIRIKNLVLKNAFGGLGGAIIVTGGDLSIIESRFTKNTAEGFYGGGAILNFGAKLSIIDSKFCENTSSKHGGAILNAGGELSIIGSEFNRNSVKNSGGAVNNDGGNLNISDSTFMENNSKHGGAVNNDGGNLTISGSSFSDNTSEYGGAVNNNNGTLTIDNSPFTHNCSKHGGAINSDRGNFTINGSKLIKNFSDDGAAVNHSEGDFKIIGCEILENESENNIILNNDSLQVYSTDFKNNKSEYIIANENESKTGIFYGKFAENNAEKSVLLNKGKSCAIEKTLFENNSSNENHKNIINQSELTLINPKIKDDGLSISNDGYILIKNPPRGIESKIYGEGEVEIFGRIPPGQKFDFGYLDKLISESKTGEIILKQDIRLENYERDFFEGGIDLDIDDLVIDGKGKTIDGSGKSRIFIVTGKNITLKNIIFKNGRSHQNYENQSNNDGGAFKINHNAELTLINCEFINNISEESGGAIKTMGDLTIYDSTLTENQASMFGGAIYNYDGKLKIRHSTLTKNISNMYGGAIDNDISLLSVIDSTFSENFSEYGGAIRNYDARLIIMSSKLTNNRAAYGAAINHREGDFKIYNCEFSNNKSENSIVLNRGLMYFNKANFKGNQSQYDILNEEEIFALSIFDGNFTEDKVDESIICNYGKSCTIENAVFENNFPDSKNIVNFSDLTLINPKIKNDGRTILNRGHMIIKELSEEIENKIEGKGEVEIEMMNNPTVD